MGATTSSARGYVFGRQREGILVQGLDGAGKTTILRRLCCGEVVTAIPTVGFNVEAVEYRGRSVASISAWDDGSSDKIRPLWRHFYRECCALVFVVDSADVERMDLAVEQLARILEQDEDLVSDWPVLVVANKQDAPGALGVEDVAARMDLSSRLCGRRWHAQGCCGLSSDGLHEGLEWLSTTLQRRNRLMRLPSRQEAFATLSSAASRRSSSSGSSGGRAGRSPAKALASMVAAAPRRSSSSSSCGGGRSPPSKAFAALAAMTPRRSSGLACRTLSGSDKESKAFMLGGAAARCGGFGFGFDVGCAADSLADTASTVDTEVWGEDRREVLAL